jgi:hypothetical protein
MILPGMNDQSVEIKVAGYQFPDNITPGDYDSNWLHIYLNVESKLGHWQTIDPSLLTWDVDKIVQWLFDLSQDKIEIEPSLEFIEPNLSFERLPDALNAKVIRIKFDLESRPKTASDEIEYYVDCSMTNEQLRLSANELAVELSKFPYR